MTEQLQNFTPHRVLTYLPESGPAVDLPQRGNVRLTETFTPGPRFPNGLACTHVDYGTASGLPEPAQGVVYLVSQLVVSAFPDRTDLAFPAGLERDNDGTIVGFRILARPAPPRE
ncbi:MAG: hypothetical protein QM518_16415 [Verrucomicrobiota bacterium]|nr:hypothetical protein [Verrucomicrobiota bacterium]